MIAFNSFSCDIYNYIIHYFLKIEVYNEEVDIGDIIEKIVPKYLYREQYRKCQESLEDLYYWSNDNYYHYMSAFHERILFGFIRYMCKIEKKLGKDKFKQKYFDKTAHNLIVSESKKYYEEEKDDFEDEEFTIEMCEDYFYNPHFYEDELFEDEDFLLIDQLYNNRLYGDVDIEEQLGIDIDYYFELLPLDIQDRYKTKHITLVGEVEGLLKYISDRVHQGSLYKLFWENDKPVDERRVQLILENIIDAYFYNQEIDITREALLVDGKVDFKLYKNYATDEKVLIEVKMAKSSKLKSGYEKQMMDYLQSANYKNGFYLIACYTDDEIDKSINFIKENIYTDTYRLYLNIAILDLRKRKYSSTL